MDRVDELAEKIVEAFEPLSGVIVLEEIAVPEDSDHPKGEIDLWIKSVKSYELADGYSVVLRGHASLGPGGRSLQPRGAIHLPPRADTRLRTALRSRPRGPGSRQEFEKEWRYHPARLRTQLASVTRWQ